jgi:hypothetical protein
VFLQATCCQLCTGAQSGTVQLAYDRRSGQPRFVRLERLADSDLHGYVPTTTLLSIAHRLAGEVYTGSRGVRDSDQIAERTTSGRRSSLGAARDKPSRPNARAVLLRGSDGASRREGDFSKRRSRVLDTRRTRGSVNSDSRAPHELLHYRWRLHYWLGRLRCRARRLGAVCAIASPRIAAYGYSPLQPADTTRTAATWTRQCARPSVRHVAGRRPMGGIRRCRLSGPRARIAAAG